MNLPMIIKVEFYPGENIEDAVKKMAEFSTRMNVATRTAFNGVSVTVHPNASVENIAGKYYDATAQKKAYLTFR